ncbi:TatD DNase family protein [Mesobacillus persicus]|uniref:TatD DNase family protein n=1 Tax=Mesobacillus persicus TaxID=930146 RepID=A0A1H8ESB4_9BACI|nr:TatD family hydrolase [Mesobacillus persicus]SEN22290.1 TatD DNase family protein [Mesobacillus persicus]
MRKVIDAHIHLDKYPEAEISEIITDAAALVAVSNDLKSCEQNAALSQRYPTVRPAFGFHPEQELPTEEGMQELFSWIKTNKEKAVAIGEVGLPYYLRRKGKLLQSYDQYIEYLEAFIVLAKQLGKPIALHAVYDDAHIVCDLLEKHTIEKAHFHWFKGDDKIVERLAANGYFISVTPDVVYESEIKKLVQYYPLNKIMLETDGPWPFEGPFAGKRTRPAMIHGIMTEISSIKRYLLDNVYEQIFLNTNDFYVVK